MYLGDSFKTEYNKKELELKVTVYNIYKLSEIPEIAGSKALREYQTLIDTIEQYRKNKENADFMGQAVQHCIDSGILKDYLKRKGGGINSMYFGEYNYEEDIRVQRKEAFDDGVAQGITQGLTQGALEANIAAAKRMLNKHMDITIISELTSLTLSQIQNIKKE